MKHTAEKTALVIATICIVCIDLAQLLNFLESGDPCGIISTLCFVAATVLLIVGWIRFFLNKKKRISA